LQHDTVEGCSVQSLLAGESPQQTGQINHPLREDLMKIHEYQGKEILRQFGVPVPRGIPAFTVQEAVEAAQKLGGPVWVVKAQIHAGGRGKGGGVKVA
jgi:acyl-CoA synthetase (NDP forming)